MEYSKIKIRISKSDLEKMRKDREKDILDSLKFIDQMVEIIVKQPNWSQKQAKLLNSFYAAVNKDWRKSIH